MSTSMSPVICNLNPATTVNTIGPSSTVVGIFGDPHARVLALTRRSKKRPAEPAGASGAGGMTASRAAFATSAAATCGSTSRSRCGALACRRCGQMKQERVAFLAAAPFYTKRFVFYVGRRCHASPIRDVAMELRLDWHTVKALDQQYMREQLWRAGRAAPGDRARRGLENHSRWGGASVSFVRFTGHCLTMPRHPIRPFQPPSAGSGAWSAAFTHKAD